MLAVAHVLRQICPGLVQGRTGASAGRRRLLPFVAQTLFLLAACQSPTGYREPEASGGAIATLDTFTSESYWVFGWSHVTIESIDGGRIVPAPIFNEVYRITPGPHTVSVRYLSATFPDLFPKYVLLELGFEAEARHAYRIRAAEENDDLHVWLEDTADKSVVARVIVISGSATAPADADVEP